MPDYPRVFFEIEVFSTVRAILEDDLSPVMIIDLGAATTKLFIVDRKVLRESHTINRGSQNITLALAQSMGLSQKEAEQLKKDYGVNSQLDREDVEEISSLVVDSIFAESNRVMLKYEKKNNRNIGKVILTGGGSAMKGILQRAVLEFEVNVVHGNPFNKVQSPAFLESVLKSLGPSFAVALGVALRKLEEQG